MARIDSHQHFWKFDPTKDTWITPEMEAIQADFLPSQLQELLDQHSLDGCVTIQVDQSAKETLLLLRYSDENPFIKGVVGWVDFRSTEIQESLEFLTRYPQLKGFRHIVQSEPTGFLMESSFLRGISLLQKFNFTYDVLIYPNQLKEATAFVRKFPDQKFVLDHLAKPRIREKLLEPWKKDIVELASAQNVYCKLSGMVTEGDWKDWCDEDFIPYMDVVLNTFGPTRILYGSDWPVCLLAASYPEQLSVVEGYIEKLSDSEKVAIMGENAVQFYNL